MMNDSASSNVCTVSANALAEEYTFAKDMDCCVLDASEVMDLNNISFEDDEKRYLLVLMNRGVCCFEMSRLKMHCADR